MEGGVWHLGPSRPGRERGHQGSTGGRAQRKTPPSWAPGECYALEAASHRLAREGVWRKVRQPVR